MTIASRSNIRATTRLKSPFVVHWQLDSVSNLIAMAISLSLAQLRHDSCARQMRMRYSTQMYTSLPSQVKLRAFVVVQKSTIVDKTLAAAI